MIRGNRFFPAKSADSSSQQFATKSVEDEIRSSPEPEPVLFIIRRNIRDFNDRQNSKIFGVSFEMEVSNNIAKTDYITILSYFYIKIP